SERHELLFAVGLPEQREDVLAGRDLDDSTLEPLPTIRPEGQRRVRVEPELARWNFDERSLGLGRVPGRRRRLADLELELHVRAFDEVEDDDRSRARELDEGPVGLALLERAEMDVGEVHAPERVRVRLVVT